MTGGAHDAPVVISFVVRLVASSLRDGQIVGEVEAVNAPERAVVRNADDLLAFFCTQPFVAGAGREPNPIGEPAARHER